MKMVKWRVKLDVESNVAEVDLQAPEQETPLHLAIKDDQASATSGFSPPVTPESAPITDPFPQSSLSTSAPSVTISETLIWTEDIINVLASDSWIVKADTILNEGTQQATDRVAKLVEEERKRAKRGEVDGDRVSRLRRPPWPSQLISPFSDSAYGGNEVHVREAGICSTSRRSFRRRRILVPEKQDRSTFCGLFISEICGKEYTARSRIGRLAGITWRFDHGC